MSAGGGDPRPDTSPLAEIAPRIVAHLEEKHAAREKALRASRALIQASARSIRQVHRGELAEAEARLDAARAEADEGFGGLSGHPDIEHAGFVHDAEKEYAEARATFALVSGAPLPSPEELGVNAAAWLNGVAEAAGELRRVILDRLRQGDFEGCEALLDAMDDIYALLVTIDFPDAMTGGLRRTTDQTRGILERTRGDLTMAIVQRRATPEG